MNFKEPFLKGKKALLIGAATEACQATAQLLGNAGALVAYLGCKPADLLGSGEDDTPPMQYLSLVHQVTNELEMAQGFGKIAAEWESLDVVVVYEDLFHPDCFMAVSEWNEPQDSAMNWTLLAADHALPLMRPGGGSVIVVSAVHPTGTCGNAGATSYSYLQAARAAFDSCPERKIRLNVISPEAVPTYLRPALGDAHLDDIAREIAELVVFLASGISNEVNGTEILVGRSERSIQPWEAEHTGSLAHA